MAHMLEIVNGEAQMFSVRETPWHRLGRIVREAPSTEEAIKLAGLDWKVEEHPIYRLTDDGTPLIVNSHKSVVRDSDDSVLGIVGEGYTPLQNREAFTFFDPFIQAKEATFETAGSLREGRNVWILAQLNRDPMEIVKGDPVRKFLLLSNGHDGSMAVRVGFTPIRVVCANTLAMSHNSKESSLIRIVHGKNVAFRLEQIREIVNTANAQFEATAQQYRFLASREINQKDIEQFVKLVFAPKLKDEDSDRKQANFNKLKHDIMRLVETGRGTDVKGVKGTYWGLYNAATEYLSYYKIEDDARRLTNLWYGRGKNDNATALSAALELAAA